MSVSKILLVLLIFLIVAFVFIFGANRFEPEDSKTLLNKVFPKGSEYSEFIPDQVCTVDLGKLDVDSDLGIPLPVVIKPASGSDNSGVALISGKVDLQEYRHKYKNILKSFPKNKFVLQEYLQNPYEAGVYVVWDRNKKKHRIVTVGRKGRNLENVEGFNTRNCLHVDCTTEETWNTPELNETFANICAKIPGLYNVRFDVKFENIDDFLQGKNFKIIELNYMLPGDAGGISSNKFLLVNYVKDRLNSVYDNVSDNPIKASTSAVRSFTKALYTAGVDHLFLI